MKRAAAALVALFLVFLPLAVLIMWALEIGPGLLVYAGVGVTIAAWRFPDPFLWPFASAWRLLRSRLA